MAKSEYSFKEKINTHFPHYRNKVKSLEAKQRDINYQELYNEFAGRDYRDHAEYVGRLFTFVKEGNLIKVINVIQENESNGSSFMDYIDSIKDSSGRSLLDWANVLHRQNILNYFFHQFVVPYFKLPKKNYKKEEKYGALKESFFHFLAKCNQPYDVLQACRYPYANIDCKNSNSETPLFVAAIYGNINAFNAFIKCGANLNSRDKSGNSLLHITAAHGHKLIIDRLIELRACFETVNYMYQNPLHIAAANGDAIIMERLLNNTHFGPDKPDKYGKTPLHYAIQNKNQAVAELLIQFKANVNQPDNDCKTPLFIAIEESCSTSLMRILMNHGADMNLTNHIGDSPLHLAAVKGKTELVKAIIEHPRFVKDNINKANLFSGDTPLMMAVRENNLEAVTFMINKNADVNPINEYSETPLYKAAEKGFVQIATCLKNNGADIHQANRDKNTPLYIASKNGHEKIVSLLIDCDVNRTNQLGNCPLYIAAKRGHEKIVERLLSDYRIKVNIKNRFGKTALYAAAKKGHVSIVEKLIKADSIDIDAKTNLRETALNVAYVKGHNKIVELILKNKAQFNPANHSGSSQIKLTAGSPNSSSNNNSLISSTSSERERQTGSFFTSKHEASISRVSSDSDSLSWMTPVSLSYSDSDFDSSESSSSLIF